MDLSDRNWSQVSSGFRSAQNESPEQNSLMENEHKDHRAKNGKHSAKTRCNSTDRWKIQ